MLTGYCGYDMIVTAIARGKIRADDEFANLTETFEMIENWHGNEFETTGSR